MTQPVQETKIVSADATALGVFGLAMITFVASTSKLGWTSGAAGLMPWALFLGSIAQIWAAAIDFKRNSYFGAIVLGAFGLFWIAVMGHWALTTGVFGMEVAGKVDGKQFGWACIGYFIFCLFITVAAAECNKIFGIILVLVDILLLTLGLQILGINPGLMGTIAAWSEMAIALLGFYAAGALFLNSFFGRPILSLGAPFGFVKKG
jgi:succinate-acetate transporter protein